jgi:hypothetical protein
MKGKHMLLLLTLVLITKLFDLRVKMNSFAKNSFAVTRQETIFGKKRRGIGLLMTHKETQ